MTLFLLVIWINFGEAWGRSRGHVEFKGFGKQDQTTTHRLVDSPVPQHIANLDHDKWTKNPKRISQEIFFLSARTASTFGGNLCAVSYF